MNELDKLKIVLNSIKKDAKHLQSIIGNGIGIGITNSILKKIEDFNLIETCDYTHCGRNLYRANYKLKECNHLSTRLFVADSFDDVIKRLKDYQVEEIFDISMVEDDISLGILPSKGDQ